VFAVPPFTPFPFLFVCFSSFCSLRYRLVLSRFTPAAACLIACVLFVHALLFRVLLAFSLPRYISAILQSGCNFVPPKSESNQASAPL
jgi:hypothetical protein